MCNVRARDISRSTGVGDAPLGKPGLKEGTPPGYVSCWECQPRQRAEPGRDKESCNVAREGFSDPGAAAIAKVHVKVKAIDKWEAQAEKKRGGDRFTFHGANSGKIRKQKSLRCCLDKIRSK